MIIINVSRNGTEMAQFRMVLVYFNNQNYYTLYVTLFLKFAFIKDKNERTVSKQISTNLKQKLNF